jgi:hypothetical protein
MQELPDTPEYQPRSGPNPPIPKKVFKILYYACPKDCKWLLPHSCSPAPASTKWKQIPQRDKCFDSDRHINVPLWGLEPVYAVSFSYVLAYHCMIVIGPVVLFGWWLGTHPDDWQNASILLVIVFGALSLFWAGAGILTSGNDK